MIRIYPVSKEHNDRDKKRFRGTIRIGQYIFHVSQRELSQMKKDISKVLKRGVK